MDKASIQCELIGWGQVQRLARRLAGLIRAAGYRPELVVGIARGGVVPARLLCDYLDLYELASIRILHYDSGPHRIAAARLTAPLAVDVRGLRVLLVDDVSDTGDTLTLAAEHIRAFAPAELRIAVLHHKLTSTCIPDFYAKKIVAWRWLTYPWALVEDIAGFIGAMQPAPATAAEAAARLRQAHGIRVAEQTIEDAFAVLRAREHT